MSGTTPEKAAYDAQQNVAKGTQTDYNKLSPQARDKAAAASDAAKKK